jgi:hypothetical protein
MIEMKVGRRMEADSLLTDAQLLARFPSSSRLRGCFHRPTLVAVRLINEHRLTKLQAEIEIKNTISLT